MASGQFVTIKLMRTGGETPWGFRLQGGKEFQMPLSVVKITGGSLSDQAGLQINDIIVKIGGAETQIMRHKEAQDAIINSGNYLELYIERGSINTWKPSITPVGDIRPQTQPLANDPQIFTRTSLEKSPQKSSPIGSGHNTSAKPFATQNMPALVHKQYNSPVNLYSEKNIEETLNAHTQVLETGATGINFIKPDAPVNKESAVYQMVHDEEMKKTKGLSTSPDPRNGYQEQVASPSVIKHIVAPVGNPTAAPQDNAGKNICADCERLIVGVFVRINNKSLHAECFRCATCGTSLKNMGYFSINDKLYCDIHARQVKSFLGASDSSTFSAAPPAPVVAPDTNFTNGFQAAQPPPAPIHPIGTGSSVGMQLTPLSNGSAPYQPVASTKISQNEVNSFSTLKKYSPVSPPTAPKPFGSQQANRNSMYISNPAPFMSDTNSTGNSKYNWPPSSNAAGNIVTYRQNTTHYTERPKSCYSSPSYPAQAYQNTSTSTCTRSNYSTSLAPQHNTNINANLQYPKTATFASRTQTTAQTIIPSQPTQMPGANLLPQTNLSSGPNAGRQLTSSTTSTFGKTLVSDSRSAPRRGRGLLQSQLSGGVIPFCGYCSQQIRGQYIMALNKTWCPNHFVCANTLCKRSLEENGFVEEQGRLYCENCYETHFAPSCAKCSQRIKGDCLNALDRQWHPNCFTCSYCKNPFGNSSFYLEDGFPYCEKDWNDLFTTKCVGCGFPIAAGDRWVEALNQNYHSTCFKCTVCHGNLEGQSFFAKGGRPFCKSHAR